MANDTPNPSERKSVRRWTAAETEVDAARVTPESAREIAEWSGGWACDDLRWNEPMSCYRYPDDDPKWPGGMFPYWEVGKVPGGVMLRYGVIVAPGDWVLFSHGHHRHMGDDEFTARYLDPEAD